MKTLLVYLSTLAVASSLYAVDTITYGDWNSAATWKNGVIPTGEDTQGVLNGNACNDTQFYYFDKDTSTTQINVGWSTGNYILKSAGTDNPTFTLYGANSSNGVFCMRGGAGGTAAETQKLTIESGNYSIVSGVNTPSTYARINLGINSPSNPNIIKNMVFGAASNVTSSIDIIFDNIQSSWATNYSADYTKRSIIDLNGTFTVAPNRSTSVRGITLNVNAGSNVSLGQLNIGNYAIMNINNAVKVAPPSLASGSSSVSVASSSTLNINNALNITSAGATHHLTISGVVNVNNGGSITSTGGYGTIQIIDGGVLRLASAAHTVQADGLIRMAFNSRLILDSTNAYWGVFNNVRSKSIWLSGSTSAVPQATAFLDVNAFNQLDGFCFGTNKATEVAPMLTVTLGMSEGVVLDMTQLTCTLDTTNYGYLMGNAKLVFVNFRNGAIKVKKEHASQTVGDITYADDFSLISAEGFEDFRLEKDASGDFFWLTATSVVPEPAAVAALMGVLALGLALHRRRK